MRLDLAHLERFDLAKLDVVTRGDLIGARSVAKRLSDGETPFANGERRFGLDDDGAESCGIVPHGRLHLGDFLRPGRLRLGAHACEVLARGMAHFSCDRQRR